MISWRFALTGTPILSWGLASRTVYGRDLRAIAVFGSLVAVPFEEQCVGIVQVRFCDSPFAKAVSSEIVVDIDEDHRMSLVNDVGSADSLLDGIVCEGMSCWRKAWVRFGLFLRLCQ